MIIIGPDDNKGKEETLRFLQNSKKAIGRVGLGGGIHKGHSFLIEKVKEEFEIVLVDHAPWIHRAMEFYKTGEDLDKIVSEPNSAFEKVKESFKKQNMQVDFLVCTKPDENIDKQTNYYLEYKNSCIQICKDLGIKNLYSQIMIEQITGNTEQFCNSFLGPKNILIDMVSRKVMSSDIRYNPEYIWKFYRNPTTFHIESRSSSDLLLGRVIKNINDEILSGKSDEKIFIDILHSWYIEDPNLSIIDIDKLEKVNCLTNNCILMCSDRNKADYILIKDGNLIF